MASQEIRSSNFRVNGVRVGKPSAKIKPGDVIVFSRGKDLRVIKVIKLGFRRASSVEAVNFYQELLIS